MIVVFVVDTSPSMGQPSSTDCNSSPARGISRLDVAKMSIEHLARSMDKRIMENNRSFLFASAQAASMTAAQQQRIDVGRLEEFDEFLLLSTSLQVDSSSPPPSCDPDGKSEYGIHSTTPPKIHSTSRAIDAHVSCGAEGRLLVGSVEDDRSSSKIVDSNIHSPSGIIMPHPPDRSHFERELKRLRSAAIPPVDADSGNIKFPDWAGGANGLNTALSHGLGMLSRYRLTRGRFVENFGKGRLPWNEHQMTRLIKTSTAGGNESNHSSKYDSPLQPACLVLLTDGECLTLRPAMGGGDLTLRFGNVPLREFYREPFRWDQRIFILHVGDASTPPLHKSLKALCEVTGGSYVQINPTVSSISMIFNRIFPPKPRPSSMADPLRLPSMSTPQAKLDEAPIQTVASSVFVNGGPVCSFQCMEGERLNKPTIHRAMLLFAGVCEHPRWILQAESSPSTLLHAKSVQSPIWCIPESHFPSKKLDVLPPRPSQPILSYSRNYQEPDSLVFDPYFVIKALHHLEKMQLSIHQLILDAGENPPPLINRMLQRDVYICEWLGGTLKKCSNEAFDQSHAPKTVGGREYFPVCVRGAGRLTTSGEGGDAILNIGILHVPDKRLALKDFVDSPSQLSDKLSTLSLLPPDAHILIPLLIKLAEVEIRVLKKKEGKVEVPKSGALAGLIKRKNSTCAAARAVPMDDEWKAELRAYLFRLPHYYLPAIRQVLSPLLPPNMLPLISFDGHESLPCYSPTLLIKIQNGEKAALDGNDLLRSMEQRMHSHRSATREQLPIEQNTAKPKKGSHQGVSTVLFRYGHFDPRLPEHRYLNSLRALPPPKDDLPLTAKAGALDPITLLSSSCLLAFYESRRRWIFGGTGLTTRGLHVEGVNTDGVNVHHCNSNQKLDDNPLLTLAGIGADSTSCTPIARMGDFKERLHFSPTVFVDYEGRGAVGTAITTASDGSPQYCVDDEAIPLHFFDSNSGEFCDSPQNRSRARLAVNFGNPFHDKRGGSVVPEGFASQRPPLHDMDDGPSTPPRSPPHSPPHDEFKLQCDGEADAAFAGKRSSPPSPPRSTHNKLITNSNQVSNGQKRDIGQGNQLMHPEPVAKRAKPDLKVNPRPPSATPTSNRPPPPSTPPPSRLRDRPPLANARDSDVKTKASRPPPPPPRKQSFSDVPPSTPPPSRLRDRPPLANARDSDVKTKAPRPPPPPPRKQSFSDIPPPPPPRKQSFTDIPAPLTSSISAHTATTIPSPLKLKNSKPLPPVLPNHQRNEEDSASSTLQITHSNLRNDNHEQSILTPDTKSKIKLNEGCINMKRRTSHDVPQIPVTPTPSSPILGPLMQQNSEESDADAYLLADAPTPAPSERRNSGSPALPLNGVVWQTLLRKNSHEQHEITNQWNNPDEKPTLELPEGWTYGWSKSQKRWYFFDTRTNKSVWDVEHIKAKAAS